METQNKQAGLKPIVAATPQAPTATAAPVVGATVTPANLTFEDTVRLIQGVAIGLDEAATLLGRDPHYVRGMCRDNKLVCAKLGNMWMISRASVEERKAKLAAPSAEVDDLKKQVEALRAQLAEAEAKTRKTA
jgi:hypothetical protein